MSKFRTIFIAAMAGGVLLSFASAANAQLPQAAVDQLTPKYRAQGPCRDPWVTLAIVDVTGGTREINGAGDFGDCDFHRYNNGSWSTYAELYQGVKTALNNEMQANLRITKQALADGTWRINTSLSTSAGDFINNQIVSHDGGTLLTQDGASLTVATVVSQGGGNVVGPGGASAVSQGGGNVVSQGGGNAVSQGGGNAVSQGGGNLLTNNGGTYSILSVSGNEARVNLGRSVLILNRGYSPAATTPSSVGSGSTQTGPGPTSNATSGRSEPAAGSDDLILICVGNRTEVRTVRRMNGSALSYTVSAGTVYFSGNVPTQLYKDRLIESVRYCNNVKGVNANNLRIGQ